jgi:hypothetical protein
MVADGALGEDCESAADVEFFADCLPAEELLHPTPTRHTAIVATTGNPNRVSRLLFFPARMNSPIRSGPTGYSGAGGGRTELVRPAAPVAGTESMCRTNNLFGLCRISVE